MKLRRQIALIIISGLVNQTYSLIYLGEERAPGAHGEGGSERRAACPKLRTGEGAFPAPRDGHHHLQSLHRGVSALRGTGQVSWSQGWDARSGAVPRLGKSLSGSGNRQRWGKGDRHGANAPGSSGGTQVRMGAASPSPAHSVPSRVRVAADGCLARGLGHPRGLELPGKGAAAPLMEKPLPKEDAAGSPGNFSRWEERWDSRG